MHRANGFTRREILTLVKLHGSMTAEGLGKQLGISSVAVRQHLASLEAEGLVATSVERRGLGRPVHRYALTPAGDETFPRRYDAFANALLDEIRLSQGEETIHRLFALLREQQRMALQPRIKGRSLSEKVTHLARIQSEGGYMADVQATQGALRLIEHNCAICQIARRHPAICEQERILFQQLLGGNVSVEREQHMLAGDPVCTYRICSKPRGPKVKESQDAVPAPRTEGSAR